MAMMKWTKPTADTIDYFERIAPGPPIEARLMFGMPSRFLNGHMLASVFGNSLMLHLSESDRLECIAAGARAFAPHGRSAAEYVEIDIGHFEDRTLKEWIARGMRYLGSLPPKLPKPKRAKSVAPSAEPVAAKRPTTKAPTAKAATTKKAPPKKLTAKKATPKKAAAQVAVKPAKAKRKGGPKAATKGLRGSKAAAAKIASPAKRSAKKLAAKKAPAKRAAKKSGAKKRR